MFRAIYYRIKYRAFFRHREGKQRFADQVLSSLMQVSKEDLERLRAQTRSRLRSITAARKLLGQKENKLPDLGLSRDKPHQAPYPREEEEEVKRKATLYLRIVAVLFIAEWVLNYLSMVILLPEEGLIFELVRIILGFVATFVAILVLDKTFLAWRRTLVGGKAWLAPIGATFISVAALVAIGALTTARANDFEAGTHGITYYGFICLSLILPIAGGWYWADREMIYAKYRRIRMWKQTMKEVHELETQIATWQEENRQRFNEEEEHFGELVHGYWRTVNFFNVLKDNHNRQQRPPISEDVAGTIAESFDRFSEKAERLQKDLRDRLYKEVFDSAQAAGVAAGSSGVSA